MKLLTPILFATIAVLLACPDPAVAATGNVDAGFPGTVNDSVFGTAVQRDGKIVIGGAFLSVEDTPRSGIARLNADGSVDPSFNPNASGDVVSIAIQADGRILVGGGFTTVGAEERNGIARLNANGSVDPNFNPNADDQVNCIAVQNDGKIVIGGNFNTVAGETRNGIARLNANGTLDSSFNPEADENGSVYSVVVQDDGKILIGGIFTVVGGEEHNYIARLNSDGTVDSGFFPSPNNRVYCAAMQADGKVVIGGGFTTVDGERRIGIARLNADGTLDLFFDPNLNQAVRSISIQADGKIIIGGYFTSAGNTTRNNLARLNPDGSLDMLFDPNADDRVWSTSLQADGRILIGGTFTTVNETPRNYFARLENDAATQSLTTPTLSRAQWLRGGSSPEVREVVFELSTDGAATWTPLGPGTRIAGGWERSGLSLTANSHIRARGRTSGGQYNGSAGEVEAVAVVTEPLTPPEYWRQTNFGSPENAGTGANTADPDRDGIENLVEFAFGSNPLESSSGQLPAWQKVGDAFVMNFTDPPGVAGITVIAERSHSLETGSWTPIPNTGVPPQHTFTVPAAGYSRLFLRLRVTEP